MKILIVSKLLPRADIIGGPILIYHRIKNLARRGHEITLLAPAYDEADLQDTSLDPFCRKVVKVPAQKNKPPELIARWQRELGRPAFFLQGDGGYSPAFEQALLQLLTEDTYDVILAEYSMMGQYLEANRRHIPRHTLTAISVHECYTRAHELRKAKGEPIPEEEIQALRAYEFHMYRAVDLVLTLTPEDRDILIAYEPRLRGRVRVVPHGVDTDFYVPPPRPRFGTRNLLYVGNFLHYPNVDAVQNFLERCWPEIQAAVDGAMFYAIGHQPPESLLRYRSDRVVIRPGGTHADMVREYWRADVFVAPIELGTGFRGKILEALATGLPVVASPLALFGIDRHRGQGLFAFDRPGECIAQVVHLLKAPARRRALSVAARHLGMEYDHRNAARKLERVLREELQRRAQML